MDWMIKDWCDGKSEQSLQSCLSVCLRTFEEDMAAILARREARGREFDLDDYNTLDDVSTISLIYLSQVAVEWMLQDIFPRFLNVSTSISFLFGIFEIWNVSVNGMERTTEATKCVINPSIVQWPYKDPEKMFPAIRMYPLIECRVYSIASVFWTLACFCDYLNLFSLPFLINFMIILFAFSYNVCI